MTLCAVKNAAQQIVENAYKNGVFQIWNRMKIVPNADLRNLKKEWTENWKT